MGICTSCDSTRLPTAIQISEDVTFHQFSYPVKVSHVLHTNPSTFICNADDMEFHGVLTAINHDDELQLGHLYFALPLSRMRRRLQPEEMAALAVKASSALAGCRRNNVAFTTALVAVENGNQCELKSSGRVADVGVAGSAVGGGGGRSRKFVARCSAIPE